MGLDERSVDVVLRNGFHCASLTNQEQLAFIV
jgi:hypothetical protein